MSEAALQGLFNGAPPEARGHLEAESVCRIRGRGEVEVEMKEECSAAVRRNSREGSRINLESVRLADSKIPCGPRSITGDNDTDGWVPAPNFCHQRYLKFRV